MMDGAQASDTKAVRDAAEAYCEGIHTANAATFEAMCHDKFLMSAVSRSGQPVFWDKASFVARISGREAFPGDADFEILAIDAAGDMAHVKLHVGAPPRRYEDYLGFFRVNGEWKLITKLFRTIDGPALEG